MCISIFVLHFLYIISDLSKNLTIDATYDLQTISLSNVDPKISYDVCFGVALANNRTLYSTVKTVNVRHSGNSIIFRKHDLFKFWKVYINTELLILIQGSFTFHMYIYL